MMRSELSGVSPASRQLTKPFGEHPFERLILVVMIAIGVILRIAGTGMRRLWDDEAFSYHMASRGIEHLFAALPLDAQPPLFYLLESLSLQLFGHNEVALRLPSLVSGLLLILASGLIATRLWSRNAGMLAAALVSMSALLAYQSVEARAYSLLALLLLVGAWCYWVHVQELTWRTGALAFVAGTAALYTHYFGVFVLLFAGLCFVWKVRSRWLIALAPLAVTAVACIPWFLLLQQQQQRHGAKQFSPDLSFIATLVRSVIVIGTGGFTEGLIKVASAAAFLLVLGVVVTVAVSRRKERCPAFPLLHAGLLFGLLHLGLMLHRWPVRDAYLSIVAPAVLILMAGAIAHLQLARPRALLLATLLLAVTTGMHAFATGQAHANPDYARLASLVREARPDGVLLARPWGDLACYAFYARRNEAIAIHGVSPNNPTEEAAVVGSRLEEPGATISRSSRVCVIGKTTGVSGFEALTTKLQASGYTRSDDETFGDARFELWQRRPASERRAAAVPR